MLIAKRVWGRLDALMGYAVLGGIAILWALLAVLPVHKAKAAISGLQTAFLSVSSAQLLALNTTPLTVVAAPGAGFSIRVISATFSYTYLTSAYTDSGAAGLYYGSSTGTLINPTATFKTTLTETSSFINSGGVISTNVARANLDNEALVLTDTANPAAGAGSMQVQVDYVIAQD
jgi:hypothetical protein